MLFRCHDCRSLVDFYQKRDNNKDGVVVNARLLTLLFRQDRAPFILFFFYSRGSHTIVLQLPKKKVNRAASPS